MGASRRQFIQWAAVGAANFSNIAKGKSAWAQALPTVALTRPDFTKLREESPYIARVRPHRKGGVRLEREGPIASPKGRKDIVHNYGHSGAGITLSWGCAMKACDLLNAILVEINQTANPPAVAILGMGVIGLTVATELRRKWPSMPLTLYSKTLDVTDTTSYNAGGQFGPSQIYPEYGTPDCKRVLISYLNDSITRLNEYVAKDPSSLTYGIKQDVNNYTLNVDEDLKLAGDWGVLHPADPIKLKLGNAIFSGLRYKTWLMNPTIMLPRLAADLVNVRKVAKTFTTRNDVLNLDETILVNCTGYGAAKIFNDDKMEPHRGHLVALKNPTNLGDFFSGGCANGPIAYVFERQHDIVVGGTVFVPAPGLKQSHPDEYRKFEQDSFDSSPGSFDNKVATLILKNAGDIFGGTPSACVKPMLPVGSGSSPPGSCATN
jgi:D-amino-acid oxidase